MDTKMTKKEYFATIISVLTAEDRSELDTDIDSLVEFCEKEIGALDKKAMKAKEAAAKKKMVADEIQDVVASVLTDEFQTIADITDEVIARGEFEDVTVHKVTYRLTSLVKEGLAEKGEITIPGSEGIKARKVKGYRRLTE